MSYAVFEIVSISYYFLFDSFRCCWLHVKQWRHSHHFSQRSSIITCAKYQMDQKKVFIIVIFLKLKERYQCFYLCFNKFISTGVFCLNDSSLQIVSMIILERWTHWRKCQQDDDNHWSCKEYPWASKQTSQNPIEVVLISFTCLVTWIDSFPTSVSPSNPTRMEYFHFSSYIS